MRLARQCVLLAMIYLSAAVVLSEEVPLPRGQPIPDLPKKLTGGVTLQTTQFVPVSDSLELEITSQDGSGRVNAVFTRWQRYENPSQQCTKARGLPAVGSYDGKRLVLKIKGSQNGPICDDYTWVFFRGKEHFFHTFGKDGSWAMYLDPAR